MDILAFCLSLICPYFKGGSYNEVLFIAFIMSCFIKTLVLVIWSLVSLYVTHPNPLLLQLVSFALTVILQVAINTSFTVVLYFFKIIDLD